MASDRQIEANRENARRSTGPKTTQGKARASLNAVRHGLSARNAVLPQEDQQAYLDLLDALEAEFRPQGPLESFLVQQMASAQWRLLRLARMETGFFMAGIEGIKDEEKHPRHWSDREQAPPKRTPSLSDEDELTRHLGILFEKNSGMDAFARLTRYENMLNTEYFRALKTLTSLRKPPAPQPPARNKTNPIPFPSPSPDSCLPSPVSSHPSPVSCLLTPVSSRAPDKIESAA